MPHEKNRYCAFTLIELLTVIIIVGILIAILVPAFSRTRALAKTAVCGNNLRQIGIAFHLYLDDHAGLFPPGGGSPGASNVSNANWEQYLYPYLDDKNVFVCPVTSATESKFYEGYGASQHSETARTRYGYSGFVGKGAITNEPQSQIFNPMSISEIKAASDTILCADALTCRYDSAGTYFTLDFVIDYRHSDGANILFVGGASKWFPQKTIEDNTDISPGENTWWKTY